MSVIELSQTGKDPRIHDFFLVETIDLSSAPADGLHNGTTQLPLNVLIEACRVEVLTAVAGDSVDAFTVSVSNTESTARSRNIALPAGTDAFSFFADVRSRFGTEDTSSTIQVFTKKSTKAASATTSGLVRVTLFGRRFVS